MKIFIDANIIVSVFNREYPSFTYTSRILSLTDNRRYSVYTSPVCLAIAYYFAEKKTNSARAKEKISLLCKHIKVTDTNASCVKDALANKAVTDFEDGLEYYSAKASGCDCIVTEDIGDYYFSSIQVLSGEAFVQRHMCKR